jgi:hypothetical protein
MSARICAICEAAIWNPDTFCEGCGSDICPSCDAQEPLGRHEPEQYTVRAALGEDHA